MGGDGELVSECLWIASGIDGDLEGRILTHLATRLETAGVGFEREIEALHLERLRKLNAGAHYRRTGLAQGRKLERHYILEHEPAGERVQSGGSLPNAALTHPERVEAHARS